jgi:xylulokinase
LDRFAGFDVSTQSCKLVVIDPEHGEVVHQDAVNYDRDLPQYDTDHGAARGLGEGVSESDPRMWTDAVETLLGRLRDAGCDPGAIRCISISGQMHGLVALDAAGELARSRSKLWNDVSTHEEASALTEALGGPERMIAAIGNAQRAGYTAPKILHLLRHEPEAYARSATFLVVHHFINWWLTGGPDGGIALMEPGDAAGTALWSPETGDWSAAVIDAIDPGLRARLPEVGPADRTIGTISPALASRYGLPADCRIDAGSGDNMYGALGTGNFSPGRVTISLGTSGTASTIFDDPWIDPTGEIACYGEGTGRFLSLLCVSNMANGYNMALAEYGLGHADFERAIAEAPPGNGGRLVIPWYEGERTPDVPLAAPLQFGFGIGDRDTAIACRGVLEGHILNLWAGFERMPVSPAELRLTGGLTRSPAWCQTIADIFAIDAVPVAGEGAALGAAMHAAWVWGREHGGGPSLDSLAAGFVRPEEKRRARPRPQAVKIHRIQRRLYRALTDRVRGLDAEDPFELRAELLRASAG